MILIVGLGNPGKKYQNNRHNVGHMFVDYSIKELRITDYGLKLIRTDCFMNNSGLFVSKLIRNQKSEINNSIIAHDDLDIPFGKFHIQQGVGPKLHNGLESIEQNLKSKDFWRIRIGVDNRPARRSLDEGGTLERWTDGIKYVLHDFLPEEKIQLEKEVFPKLYTQLQTFLKTQFFLSL
ncbi:MAG: Peptidyl-tRNA hydrolase [Candidatus Roizmanbacteria bacterium GW2011_GWC2_37_13]|uniref:Peptidyl-tRNA hydrolase n=1 Tax=Candidatus Roizmanbacteria bacterium GW2011_GWC2_37_13 TaxID=1618486 RepID=A0A0G0G7I0_9BACT|nr:MAG: hypothetical protein US38_C0001G0024 [Candidatus Roizmanbacteria bacterium GW2011_GWC1_37_12]KKQ26002.1 MAG: Peptidyl-tRNA hydrolase [Candidatus Roizmanbacteria bacterium GW2011_GWC2_37_13]